MSFLRWQDIKDEKEKYAAYLASAEWWAKRNAVQKRCNGVCEKCGYGKMAHTHHLTYIRKYNERLTDLIGVCVPCHNGIHNPPEPPQEFDYAKTRMMDAQLSLALAKTPQQRARMIIHFVRFSERARCKSRGQRFKAIGWHPGMSPREELQFFVDADKAWRIAKELFARFMDELTQRN